MIDTQFSKMISHDIAESLAYVPNAISTISVLKKKPEADQESAWLW
ncbi:hypothetical protein [Flagellimonas beolgyonensis]|nr:hypothetical protein [Allomuricauda beolgyonensis]